MPRIMKTLAMALVGTVAVATAVLGLQAAATKDGHREEAL